MESPERFKRQVEEWKAAGTPENGLKERGLELEIALDAAKKVFHNNSAYQWMFDTNIDLNLRSPVDVIEAGRYKEVIYLIYALAEGVTA